MTDAAAPLHTVRTRTISLPTSDGGQAIAFVAEPEGPGPYPAIAFGAEAMGPNKFGRKVAADMAALGYVTITPDYYRGGGPSQPDNYNDFTEVMGAIDALDFRQATYDVLAGVDWLRAQPQVDPGRVAVWGYCTGGTLAMLAASLDRKLSATVLFFPSQPRFEALTVKRPAHPIDLVWSITSPVLLIYGDQDPIMPPDLLAELRRRFDQWGIRNEVRIYPGAGHAFSADAPHMHNAEATAASWEAATNFLERNTG
jgi:carboxymethylenebutenolidase